MSGIATVMGDTTGYDNTSYDDYKDVDSAEMAEVGDISIRNYRANTVN